jgi:asparagine synthase (glutamine-hydrolysing)
MSALGYRDIATFNVDFGGVDSAFNEARWAEQAAAEFHTRHHRITIPTECIAAIMTAALRTVDQPSFDGFNHYLAFQAIAGAGYKVALTGQGADELFYGYARHRAFALSYYTALLSLPSFVRHGISRSLTTFLPGYYRFRKSVGLFGAGERTALAYASRHCIFTAEEIAHLIGRPVASPIRFLPESMGDTPLARLYDLYSQHFLPNQLLRDGDQMSMAVSLELRAPFVDHRVVDAVKPLPTRYKIAPGRQKPLLVDAVNHPLVSAAAERPKSGFPIPLRRWLKHDMQARELFPEVVGLTTARARQILGRSRRGIEYKQAWTLYVLAAWMRDNRIAPIV